jgi:alkyl hydroperoxide reductase subunit AhpC
VRFPLLADPKRDVIRAYGVEDAENEIAWPAIFVIGHDGRVQRHLLTDNYKERPLSRVLLDDLPSSASSGSSKPPPAPPPKASH